MKRFLSIIVSLMLILSSMPNIAFAEDESLPSAEPTVQTETASPTPTATPKPTEVPTKEPTATPTDAPTEAPAQAAEPSEQPSDTETAEPTETPVDTQTAEPTETPANTQTIEPETSTSPEPTETTPTVEPQSSEAPAETEGAPVLSADKESLNFESLTEGYADVQSLAFSIANTGDADAELLFSAPEAFTVSAAVAVIPAGGSITINVSPVTGLAAGSYQETLAVSSGEERVTIALSVEVTTGVALLMAMLDGDASTLPAPEFVTAESSGVTSITIRWSEVDGASSYNVYQSTIKNGTYVSVVQRTTGTSYVCTGLTCGTVYYFKVAAYDIESGEGTRSVATSGVKPRPVTPDFTSASSSSMYSNKLTWTPLTSGCSGYTIYAQADNDTASGFVLVGTRASKTYSYFYHTGLTPNVTYTYYICSYYNVTTTSGTTVVESEPSIQLEATPSLPVVENFSAFSNGAMSVKLTWSREADVTGYIISRSDTESGVKTDIATITDNTTVRYIDESNLIPGTEYYYSIKTYLTVNSTDIYSDEATAHVAPVPSAPTSVNAASYAYDKIRISWSAVTADNASGFCIYRKPGNDSDDFELIDTITYTTSYIDGNVNPLETGTAYFYYVTAYRMIAGNLVEGDVSDTVNARPKPEQVQNLVAAQNSYNSLALSWDECNGAEQYIIMQKTSSTGTFYEIGRTDGDETAYMVTDLTCGKKYYFCVVGIVTAADSIVTKGAASDYVTARPLPATPEDFAVTYISGTSVKLTWTVPVEGATGYGIQRSTEQDANYVTIGYATSSDRYYYYDTGLTTAETYYYRIYSYVSSSSYRSDYSNYITVCPMPGKPVITSVDSYGCTSLNIKWNSVSSVDGYLLMYATSENGDYKEVDISSGTSTSKKLIDAVQAGQTIYVKLQAYVNFNNVKEYGEVSDIVTGSAAPSKVKNFKVSSSSGRSLALTWSALDSTGDMADGYYIYQCADENGTDPEMIYEERSGDAESYTVTDLDVGEYYYFYIVAYCGGASGDNVAGERSDIDSCSVKPVTPDDLTATNESYNSIYLSWSPVDGADGYEIYYSYSSACVYRLVRIDDSGTTEYIHENMTQGKRYYYKIRSYSIVNGDTYLYSEFSSAINIYTRPAAPTNLVAGNSTTSGKPRISWDAAEGATKYVVYYSTTENGEYIQGPTTSSGKTYAYVSGLTPGRTYWFKVKSQLYYNGTARDSLEFSEAIEGLVLPGKPSSVTGSTQSYKSIKYSWSSVSNAVGYKISCYLDDDTLVLEKEVGNITSYTLTDKRLSGNYINTTITAFCYEYGSTTEKVYGPPSTSTVRNLPRLSAPSGVSVSCSDSSSMTVKWNTVTDAEGYRIERSVGDTSNYETVVQLVNTNSSADSLEWTDEHVGEAANVQDKVYYRVSAFIDYNGTYLYGKPSSNKYTRLRCDQVTGVEATPTDYKTIMVTWDEVEGATYYRLYRATSLTGTYSYIGYTSITSYSNSGRTTGTTYYYKVKGYFRYGTTNYYGPISEPSNPATPTLDSVTGLSAQAVSASKVRLSWERPSGASGYYIYRSLEEDSGYSKIKTLSSASTLYYYNGGRQPDTTYYYRIRAYRTTGTTKYLGELVDFDPVTTPAE